MTIRQVIDLAKTSELANLSIGNKDEVVLGYINLGMIELYKRFNLRVEEWIITLEDNVDIYTTPSDFMWAVAAYGEVTDNQTSDVDCKNTGRLIYSLSMFKLPLISVPAKLI